MIVEGYTDVLAAHQAGFENVVASLGTALTAGQVELATRYADAVALAYDVDLAGETATQRGLLEELGPVVSKVRVIRIPAGKDPDEFIKTDPDGWRTAVADATELLPYFMQRAAGDVDMRQAQGRSAYTRRMIDLLRRIPDRVEQDSYVPGLAKLAGIDERVLRDELARGPRALPVRPLEPAARDMGEPMLMPLEREALTLLLLNPGLAAEQGSEPLPLHDEWARALGEAWIAAVKASGTPPPLEAFVTVSTRPVASWRAACWHQPAPVAASSTSTSIARRSASACCACGRSRSRSGSPISRHSSASERRTRTGPPSRISNDSSRCCTSSGSSSNKRSSRRPWWPAIGGIDLVATTTTTRNRPKGGTTEAKPKATAKPAHQSRGAEGDGEAVPQGLGAEGDRDNGSEGFTCEGTSHQGHGIGQVGGHGNACRCQERQGNQEREGSHPEAARHGDAGQGEPRQAIDNGRGRQGTAQGIGSEADRHQGSDQSAPAKPAAKKASPSREAAGQNGKASAAVIEGLLNKGRSEGFITQDQILEAVPQPEANLAADRGAVRGRRGERRRGPGRGEQADPDRRARARGRGAAEPGHQARGRGGSRGAGGGPHRHRRPGSHVPQGDRQGRPPDRRGRGGARQGDRAGREGGRGPGTGAGQPLHLGQHQLDEPKARSMAAMRAFDLPKESPRVTRDAIDWWSARKRGTIEPPGQAVEGAQGART